MGDGTGRFFTNAPESAYGTESTSVEYPGTQAGADVAAAKAMALVNDRLPAGVTLVGVSITKTP